MTSDATSGPPTPRAGAGEISFIEILSGVLRNWRAVLILPVALALFVGITTLNRKRSYYATASFVPQMAESRGVSGAAALAQQFGVSLGTDRPGQSPQFYESLLKTGTILRRAVESDYQITSETGQVRTETLVAYWRLSEQQSSVPPWRRGVDRLRAAVATSVHRETGVIDLTVTSNQPLLAEQIGARLLELLNDYNLEMRQTRARDEARFIGGRSTETQGELRAAESALESFLRQNRDFRNSPELTFGHDRLQRQVIARQEVYTSLLRAQEQARIDGMRDTPVLQIIDSPVGAALPSSRKTVLRTLIAFMVGFLLAVGLATVKEAARRARQTNDPQYREFEDLVRRVWSDLLHPRRWLGAREKYVAGSRD